MIIDNASAATSELIKETRITVANFRKGLAKWFAALAVITYAAFLISDYAGHHDLSALFYLLAIFFGVGVFATLIEDKKAQNRIKQQGKEVNYG